MNIERHHRQRYLFSNDLLAGFNHRLMAAMDAVKEAQGQDDGL